MVALILTNGDSAVDLLQAAGKSGRIVPWRDCLHEGPLCRLATSDDEAQFRNLRTDFLTQRGWSDPATTLSDFEMRDAHLDQHDDFDEIELWFEHDLYDQLQLIEILTRLYSRKRFVNVSLIQAERYLGMMSPETILDLEVLSAPVSEQMMAIADLAWQTLSHETPLKLMEFVGLKPAGFLFLSQALRRLLEELPGVDGLSRTERQIIYSLDRGVSRPGMLFARSQAMEEAQFWGDWGFFTALSGLAYCEMPLIEGLPDSFSPRLFDEGETRKAFLQSELRLTPLGHAVLEGRGDFAAHNRVERFVGGTHVKAGNFWRYNQNTGEIIHPDN